MRYSHLDPEKSKTLPGDKAETLFESFLNSPPDRAFVVAQLGQSLDGRIATLTGESRYINRTAALDHLHRIRAHVDAVVVGIGTVLADNPRLNVRRVDGPNPARVVIDPSGRLPAGCHCMNDDGARRIVIRKTSGHCPAGAHELVVPEEPTRAWPANIVDALFAQGMRRLLIEGGAKTISTFIDAGCVDRLHVLVAPMIIGSGKTGLDLAPIATLDMALRPATRVYVLDDGDVLFDCDLRRNQGGPAAP
jgi:diaminohydroxyphosphoribosylaminopyrimidine deaminase/5-amino-6-(5-phosphoribosylamino)uracil reductase